MQNQNNPLLPPEVTKTQDQTAPVISSNQPTVQKHSTLPSFVRALSIIYALYFCAFALIYGYSYLFKPTDLGSGIMIVIFGYIFLFGFAVYGVLYLITLCVYFFSRYPNSNQRVRTGIAIIIITIITFFFTGPFLKSVFAFAMATQPMSDKAVIQLIENCDVKAIYKDHDKIWIDHVSSYKPKDFESRQGRSKNLDLFLQAAEKARDKCGHDVTYTDYHEE